MFDLWCVVVDDFVDYVLCLLQNVWVFEQEIGGKGQEFVCCFMFGDEKCDYLENDIFVIEFFVCYWIDIVQYLVQQVYCFFVVVWVFLFVFDYFCCE